MANKSGEFIKTIMQNKIKVKSNLKSGGLLSEFLPDPVNKGLDYTVGLGFIDDLPKAYNKVSNGVSKIFR